MSPYCRALSISERRLLQIMLTGVHDEKVSMRRGECAKVRKTRQYTGRQNLGRWAAMDGEGRYYGALWLLDKLTLGLPAPRAGLTMGRMVTQE